jgi:hypothetical protein
MSELNSLPLHTEVCSQIKKDFILAGFEFNIADSFSIDDFIPFVVNSFAQHGKQFKRLLYTFDFSEKQIGDALSNQKNDEALIILAHLFVKKAKQKVEFRKRFSNQSLNLPDHINLHNGIQDLDSKSETK